MLCITFDGARKKNLKFPSAGGFSVKEGMGWEMPNTSREGGRVDDRGRLNTTGLNFCASIIPFISELGEEEG